MYLITVSTIVSWIIPQSVYTILRKIFETNLATYYKRDKIWARKQFLN